MIDRESTIVVADEFADGLYRIEDDDSLVVLFYLHESGEYDLRAPRRYGVERGTFACRSPHRPSPIGSTTVELLERDGPRLRVAGLDAIDGYVRATDREAILLEAGVIHGHFCPYLALGVMAGVHARRELGVVDAGDGMEDVVAIVETNSCFADGVQVATGCTFGNNALVYRDYGKTAVTLVDRERPGEGVRVHVKEREDPLESEYPEASDLFDRVVADRDATPEERERFGEVRADVAFDLIDRSVFDVCDVETGVAVDLPEYAPIFEDATCAECGEQVMVPKVVERDGETLCRACADAPYHQLDGRGLNRIG